MKKLRVGVLFGGRSGEHEVSLLSAASVLKAIDKKKYDVVPIGITKEGRWVTAAHAERLLQGQPLHPPDERHLRAGDPDATAPAAVLARGEGVVVPPMPGSDHSSLMPFETDASELRAAVSPVDVDIIFPVLHGTFGEDGTIQGLLELADIAYVGAGVLGSAAGMDKDVMKRLFRDARLPIVKHVTVLRSQWRDEPKKARKQIEKALQYPVFVKPANLGSSVGISKVHDSGELAAAMDEAARYDRKLVIEEGVGGRKAKAREIECAVLGNDAPIASIPGEIVPVKEFYDYSAKYLVEGSEAHHPRAHRQGAAERSAAAGHRRLPGGGLLRPGARRLPDGSAQQEDVRERDQHHAGIHLHQHVSQDVGGQRDSVSRAHGPADSARYGAPRREEAEPVQAVMSHNVG